MDKKFKELASKIYINPSKKVLESLEEEYNFIQKNLEFLNKIDTTNVEPMTRISQSINILREDEIDSSILIPKKVLLDNGFDKDEDYIIMKRIFK